MTTSHPAPAGTVSPKKTVSQLNHFLGRREGRNAKMHGPKLLETSKHERTPTPRPLKPSVPSRQKEDAIYQASNCL